MTGIMHNIYENVQILTYERNFRDEGGIPFSMDGMIRRHRTLLTIRVRTMTIGLTIGGTIMSLVLRRS